ncbi:hypothetical protein N9878_01250 [bacterium]|nr:hypothetical protein [bacterium]
MATEHKNLYAVGPGSIGPGTTVTTSLSSPQKNSGVVTHMYEDPNGITASALLGLQTVSDDLFPGTSIVLDRTTVRQISNTLALIVSYYGKGSSANGFRTVMTRSPGGYRQEPYWSVSSAYTKDSENYSGSGATRKLLPQRILTIPLVTVQWSSVVYSDSRPSDNQWLVGRVNNGPYTIDEYEHATGTLKFEGTQIRHDKNGGYTRWTRAHTATYDPFYKHRTSVKPIRGAPWKAAGGPETFAYTLSNSGDGVLHYPTAAFPTLT